jgi:hypothetical protein
VRGNKVEIRRVCLGPGIAFKLNVSEVGSDNDKQGSQDLLEYIIPMFLTRKLLQSLPPTSGQQQGNKRRGPLEFFWLVKDLESGRFSSASLVMFTSSSS